ncbi:DUF11 domain-containing protein [Wenzhouxiangella sp. AB-CW3]|uniref:DUF11 domain-containing protein n=1 Tax=Wenzhouxiangella sp. AB-CW3 TaxID=2771012 RepID=UPI00168C0F45|nr:DUF11 domain-containing protein [Wenzhouxiangella sp. AB-CW3]QOC22612.1 DUF11 domain-containing protein [Wenzhouxiangella sp. AB-CW3]
MPGDIIEYTITFENAGNDGADLVVVTDQIPAGTTYVPDSLEIIDNASGAPTGPQSDAAGDDLAEFDAVANQVIFRLGDGADENNGGLIPGGETGGVRFQVQIDDDDSMYGATVENLAVVTHIAETLTELEFEGQAEVETEVADPAIALTKTIESGDPYAEAGDSILYSLVATNTGSATLHDVSIVDPDAVLSNCSPSMPATLSPGQTLSCDGAYTVEQADVDAGSFTNTATVTATADNDDEFSDQDSATASGPTASPELDVNKILSSAPDPVEVGSVLTYTIAATNTGNVTLNNVVVSDPMISVTGGSSPCATLLPGDSCTLIGEYSVIQDDVDSGAISNTATANSDETGEEEDTLVTDLDQDPSLAIVKELSDAPDPIEVGSVLTYTIAATNTGNVTLNNVVVSDPMISVTGGSSPCATLLPGDSCTLIGEYSVIQDDVDSGAISNTATANSDETGEEEDTLVTDLDQDSSLAIVKELSDAPDPVEVGSVLTYTVTATNSGNVTLQTVRVDDPITTPSSIECSNVEPGGECVLVGTYTVSESDQHAGGVDNVATATGSVDGSTDLPEISDDHQIPVQALPAIPVPILSTLGLMLFMLLMLASGWLMLRHLAVRQG